MMTKDEIMKVLDAMNYAISPSGTFWVKKHNEAKQILQAALAEPEGEPATVLRLIDTIKYLVGIAERGKGRKARDDELPEQFVLGYVKRLEAALAEPSEADDTSCPTCGEDGGTSCGMPNCGLLIGESDVEPQNEPVAWQLGHRFYTSLKDAEYAWRNDCAFLGTSYVPEPLFTHPASKPEPSEPVEASNDEVSKIIELADAYAAACSEFAKRIFTYSEGSLSPIAAEAGDIRAELAAEIEKLYKQTTEPSEPKPYCCYCESDNEGIRSTYFDQTCEGCVKRMTRPAKPSPLSKSEIISMAYDCNALPECITDESLEALVRAVEAAVWAKFAAVKQDEAIKEKLK